MKRPNPIQSIDDAMPYQLLAVPHAGTMLAADPACEQSACTCATSKVPYGVE
ncbi:MAG: hypothetical protein M0030_24235 [Actinomycetota bacterium]|nr:hypothetical protein [Actinomycetota bacterium]